MDEEATGRLEGDGRPGFEELQKEYGDEFVAIDQGKVIEHKQRLLALVKILEEKHKDLANVLVQFIPKG